MEKFTVTINYHGNYGYIEYDPETKSAAVHLGVEAPRAAVEKYLAEPHTFKVCVGPTIRDFKEVTLQPLESLENFQLCLTRMWVAQPLESLENFQLCLTRMWVAVDVRVEWSMPPGMAENL